MYDLIIVGGGAAALSAAVFAFGKQLDTLVIYEKMGGRAGAEQHLREQTTKEYLAGAEAAAALARQVAAQEGHTLYDRVTDVAKVAGIFRVATEAHGVYESLAVIVATGASATPLNAVGADELLGQGLGYSATTHAHIVAGKHVAVIGTTVRALRGAAELARSAEQVYLIAPESSELDAPLARGLRRYPNVEFLEGYRVKWCITCQVNKSLVLERGEVREALSRPGVIAMRADWTRPDPVIADYLASFGRYGIPFDVVYGPSRPHGEPLPEILSTRAVSSALERAAR